MLKCRKAFFFHNIYFLVTNNLIQRQYPFDFTFHITSVKIWLFYNNVEDGLTASLSLHFVDLVFLLVSTTYT